MNIKNKVKVSKTTRNIISYIPQGNTLFSGSILENLKVGKENATYEEIEKALKNACALKFVNSLRDGINTKIEKVVMAYQKAKLKE